MSATDPIRFAGAALSLLGLGIIAGFSPTLVALVLRLLDLGANAKRAITYLLLGLVLGVTALLLLLQLIDPRSLETLVKSNVQKDLIHRSVDLVAAAVFLTAGLIMAMRVRAPRRPRKPQARRTGRSWEMFLVGVTNPFIGFSGFATVYLAARLVRASADSDPLRLISFAIFLAAVAAPYIALAWAWQRFPQVAERITALFRRIAQIDLRPWASALALLAGLAFLGLGIWGTRSG